MNKFFLWIATSTLLLAQHSSAQSLQTAYDQRGLVSLAYNGVSLVNLDAGLGDAFLVGGYNIGGNGGWGGSGYTANWNPGSQTLTWSWTWGSVACQFTTPGGANNLLVTITVQNTSNQTLNSINIFPLGLQFPSLPQQFGSASYPQFHNNLDAPVLIPADYGSGMLVLADGDAKPLYLGFSPSGAAGHYELEASTTNDSTQGFLATAVPVNRPVAPGQTDTYSFSLRFAPSGTDYHSIASDVLTTFGQTWPQTLNWSDRRPIGELFMTNPTSSSIAGSSPNPRNYTVAQSINIQSQAGLSAFQQAVLAYADNSVQVLKNMNAQGAVVWDLEGQQYSQPNTSYVGDPSQLAAMSPEMNGIADAFFARFTNAGLRCGMTIRPQTLDLSVSPPNQNSAPATAEAGIMIQKIQYAYKRWGCTLFYVDSDDGPDDSTAASTFQQVMQALPNVLIIPENIWPKDSAYTAPLGSFWAPYKPLHTAPDEKTMWPNAFTVSYVGDAPNHDLTNNPNNPNQWSEFLQAVKNGDILSFRAWFDDEPLNNQILELYSQSHVSSAQPAPPTLVNPIEAPASPVKRFTSLAPAATAVSKAGNH